MPLWCLEFKKDLKEKYKNIELYETLLSFIAYIQS